MSSMPLARLSISLPGELLQELDEMVAERNLPSRSQMISELIRHELAEHGETQDGVMLAGTLTLIYAASGGRVRNALAQAQGRFVKEVISSQHVFLENDQSLEVLLLQGPARRLNELRNELRKVRGVLQTRLVTTTALLPPLHSKSVRPAASPARAPRRTSAR
jgi:CopG family nickel-responsive transcriptional regulator